MSTTIAFDLKQCFDVLTQEDRWNVLTVLILHANIRNRCWPTMETIARLATNGTMNRAVRAKKWLEEHGAIELVPYAKRHGKQEEDLPRRQHIYQLTGVVNIEREGKPTVQYPYLYKRPEVLESETSNLETSAAETSNLGGQSISIESSISSIESNSNIAVGADTPVQKRKIDVIFDAVALGSFSVADASKATGGRIAKLSTWIKKNYPDCTPEHLAAFYIDYDRATQGKPRPRTPDAFEPRFISWWEKRGHSFTRPSPRPTLHIMATPSQSAPMDVDDGVVQVGIFDEAVQE